MHPTVYLYSTQVIKLTALEKENIPATYFIFAARFAPKNSSSFSTSISNLMSRLSLKQKSLEEYVNQRTLNSSF
jgi:hypothetical protein